MLVALSEIDNEIFALEQEESGIPKNIQEFNNRTAELTLQTQELKIKLQDLEKQKNEDESFILEKKEWLNKREDQIKEIKTTKEFSAAQKETSTVKKEIADREILFLQHITGMESSQKEIQDLESKNAPRIEEIQNKIEDTQKKLAEIGPQISEKQKMRNGIAIEIKKEDLEIYEQIRKKVQPVLSKAEDCICTECGNRIQPQLFNQLYALQTLLTCKRCKRILYLEEILEK